MAGSEAAKEAVYHRRYHRRSSATPTPSRLSSRWTTRLWHRHRLYNPELHTKTKPLARRHFFISELVEEQRILVPFVKTTDNWADFFTKPLKPKSFTNMRNTIMNIR